MEINRISPMRIRHGGLCVFAALVLFAATLASAEAVASPTTARLTVSVAPQFTAVKIQRAWTPFLERLTVLTGVAFDLRHYPSIPAFEEGFKRGETDLVYLGPYHAVTAKHVQGYRPLWHDTTPLAGILVVRADSKITSLKQLVRANIAFPAPNAFGASLYIRGLLETEGIPFTPVYVNTHQNVYRSVLLGDTQAGGGVKRTLGAESASVQGQLRILYTTPAVAPHPVVAHPRVSSALQEKILAAVLVMGAGSDRSLLADVGFEAPIRADYARDYAPLEKLNLERLLDSNEGAR